jgi:hypothetical protein
VHTTVLHLLCALVEERLMGAPAVPPRARWEPAERATRARAA